MSQQVFNDDQKRQPQHQRDDNLYEPLVADHDLLSRDIMEKVEKTPIGQLLQKISSMPEIRQDKVLKVRREISGGKYDLNDRLDVALDSILEELLI